jgi:murein DD-endopeptidase MepM/ murein hydrolase activator NlpD
MTRNPLLPVLGSLVAASFLIAGCAEQGPPPTPTKTPIGLVAAPSSPPRFNTATLPPTATSTPTSTPLVTDTPIPTETPLEAPTWTPPPTNTPLPPERNHYWMSRPIAEEYTNFVDRNYPYGSTGGGKYRVHHGYEFQNPRGTPIIAPAESTVVFAGEDLSTQFGPQTHYYGFLVVLRLDAVDPTGGQPIFMLFGHMDTIEVEVGDRVEAGDQIGTVGNSGVALGAHLHFEVRLGDMYDFNSVRNPDLWLGQFNGFGTLVGRVEDGNGNPLPEVTVTVRDVDGAYVPFYTWTYADDTVQPDDTWEENFTLGDLPEGWYRVYIHHPTTGKTMDDYIFIESRKTTWIEFVAD